MAENSFDVVSNVDLQEVKNAIAQAMKEISNRFDLKGSHSNIELTGPGASPIPFSVPQEISDSRGPTLHPPAHDVE